MDFRQIRYFTYVASLRSFSKAAQALNVAQPSISRQIQTLEKELDTQLLFRTTRGVEPTEAGLVLLQRAEQLLQSLDETRDAITAVSARPAGDVSLGLPPSLSPVFAPAMMAECTRLYPAIRLRITEGLSVFLEEWLKMGRIDLAVLTKLGEMPNVTRVSLGREELVLVAPRGTVAPGQTTVPLCDLTRRQITIPHGFRNVIDHETRGLGITLIYKAEYDSISIIRGLLEKGDCFTILPYALVQQEAFFGDFDVLRIVDPCLSRELVLAANPRRPCSSAAKVVRSVVTRLAGQVALRPTSDQFTRAV
jgi:LysR family nitrogen assimilation transcriptional regulator